MNDKRRIPRTMLAYDGELIDGRDATTRYERDKQLQQKYVEAENSLEPGQMTFEDVKKKLRRNIYK